MVVELAVAGVVRDVTYQFDAAGNRTNVTERGVVTNSLTYTVNTLNQYTRAKLGSGGALGYWNLDEGTGVTATDLGSGGNNGSLVNGPLWTSGISSNGLFLTNHQQRVSIPHNNQYNLTNSLTLALWIKPAMTGAPPPSYSLVLHKNAYASGFGFYYTDGRQIVFQVTGANGNSLTSAAKLPTNAWTQITGTFDGSQARFYLNGVLDRTLTWSGTRLTNSQALWVGYYSGSYAVSGRVDEARIYAPALSASDVNLLSQGREYTYDTNGNLTSDGSWTYNYDYENRLTKAYRGDNLGSSASAVHYTYDALGRLAERRTSGDTVTTNRMYYAGWQLIAEYNGAGNLQRKYVYGPGIDEPVRLTSGSNRFYYHPDGLGSVTEITTNGGFKVESYTYDVYGTPTVYNSSLSLQPSSLIGTRLLFTGRDRDADTTLYNYRYRYYSPSLGRFVQPDPVGIVGGDNLYRYAINNATTWKDSRGAAPQPAGVEFNLDGSDASFKTTGDVNWGDQGRTHKPTSLQAAILRDAALSVAGGPILTRGLSVIGRGLFRWIRLPCKGRLFRAVGPDELADLRAAGNRYRVPSGGTERKYFFETPEQASNFARMMGDKTYTTTSVRVSPSQLGRGHPINPTREGPGYFLRTSDVPSRPVTVFNHSVLP